MLAHLMLNVFKVFKHFVATTLDVKDAFLMAEQPAAEKAFVELDGQIYKHIKCLPGQCAAASQCFQLVAGTATQYGLEQDPMQPTLLTMKKKEIYITVHVDDVFTVGNETALRSFVALEAAEGKGWNIEEKGPFNVNEKFPFPQERVLARKRRM